MNHRESLATALHSSHLEHGTHDCPIDKIGALARSDDLGAALWRLKYGRDDRALPEAARILYARVVKRASRKRWRNSMMSRYDLMVKQCLDEYLIDKCKSCHGRGELGSEYDRRQTVRSLCGRCGGNGRAIYKAKSGGMVSASCSACCGFGTVSRTTEAPAQKPFPCPACGGQKARQVFVEERLAIGITQDQYSDRWERYFAEVLGMIAEADRKVNRMMNFQLDKTA